jgi:hypothetical protein
LELIGQRSDPPGFLDGCECFAEEGLSLGLALGVLFQPRKKLPSEWKELTPVRLLSGQGQRRRGEI